MEKYPNEIKPTDGNNLVEQMKAAIQGVCDELKTNPTETIDKVSITVEPIVAYRFTIDIIPKSIK